MSSNIIVKSLTAKEIADLKIKMQLTKTVVKPKILTSDQTLTNLNSALTRARIRPNKTPIPPPPTTLTLTPASPTSTNGQSSLRFDSWGGGPAKLGVWDGTSTAPYIQFNSFSYLLLVFETVPTKTYAVEISTGVDKSNPNSNWIVIIADDNSKISFPSAEQTLTLAFKAKSDSSLLELHYAANTNDWSESNAGNPKFYSAKLMPIP